MMERELLNDELRNVEELKAMYRECAELVAPSRLEENPAPLARAYMVALRGVERCIELKLKLVREVGLLPEYEPKQEEPMVMIDFTKLSYEALHEVKQALMPVVTSGNGDDQRDDRSQVCEKPKKKKSEMETKKRRKIKPET